MNQVKPTKTLELTVEVITRSTVKVVVEVAEEVGLSRYGEIGKALFDAIPQAMFNVVERRFERVSFDKSDGPAIVSVADDGEGALRLSKCVDKVDLVLEECGSLHEDGHFVFCAGHDNKRQPVITWPVNPNSVVGVTAKVTPFTEANKQIVLARLANAFAPDALPEGLEVTFQEFGQDELKFVDDRESYAEILLVASVKRSEFTYSSWDEFSSFAYGIYDEDPCNLTAADIRVAIDHYMAKRTVATHSVA
ncbi:TPA: hypothetical protein MXR76_005899 [Pseudomonas aeruginosa]|nr:hypothetical protein [Pseudomonas aeruginosa]HCA7378884.1 hypothetical protein [Pseudomonas aeruginosa]HCA7776927.1 hypothetical protein [Pseudomonas aeruginosa]